MRPRAEALSTKRSARAFAWLPDAPLDPHPLLTWTLQCSFDLVLAALFRKEEIVPAGYALEPGTLVVSNHQRDCDVPLLFSTLCRREGVRIKWPLPFSAARDDMFAPGFLAELAPHWPAPLPALLRRLPVDGLVRILRARPIRRLPEFTFGAALAACAVNPRAPQSPTRLLNARGKREVAARIGELPENLGQLLADPRLSELRRSYWGLRRLSRAARAALMPGLRAEIDDQLGYFAHQLDARRVLYFAPEGTTSRSGAFGRVRAGLWRLCRLAKMPPAILPAALSYDAFDAGRARVVIRVGTPLRGIDRSDASELEKKLRQTILQLYPVTASHLASHFVAAGPGHFTTQQFCAWMGRGAQAVARAGLTLDPLFVRGPIEDIARARLRWLARKKLVLAKEAAWCNVWPHGIAPGWNPAAAAVRYFDNALGALEAVAPHLGRSLWP